MSRSTGRVSPVCPAVVGAAWAALAGCTPSAPASEVAPVTRTAAAPVTTSPVPSAAPRVEVVAAVAWPALSAPASLALSPVAVEVERRLAALEQCYQRRLIAVPGLAGAVVMHWTVGPAGQVDESCVTSDSLGDAAVRTCVDDLLRRAPFPAGARGDASFAFVFDPGPLTLASR